MSTASTSEASIDSSIHVAERSPRVHRAWRIAMALFGTVVPLAGVSAQSALATGPGARASDSSSTTMVARAAPSRASLAPRAELGMLWGVRLPAYDRVDGLSLRWGPRLGFGESIFAEPIVTYRSDLGTIDPMLDGSMRLGPRDTLRVRVGRETATNDAWMRSELLNSLSALWNGNDERNYYRRDLAALTLAHAWSEGSLVLSTFVGASVERGWSVGPDSGDRSAPFSLMRRRNASKGMLRPNPVIARGTIASARAGATMTWWLDDVLTNASVAAEVPWSAPADARFVQLTLDASVAFPTFGAQRLFTAVHAVVTGPDRAPPQRFAYMGGTSTLPTIEPTLALGGDQLLFVQTSYDVPISRFDWPYLGSPMISLVNYVGAAGVHRLPALTDNVGLRASLSYLSAQWLIDPSSRRRAFSVALTVPR